MSFLVPISTEIIQFNNDYPNKYIDERNFRQTVSNSFEFASFKKSSTKVQSFAFKVENCTKVGIEDKK